MTIIPEQLSRCRFIKVRVKEKIPCEKDWQKTANYAGDDKALQSWLVGGGNYGVCGGYNNLLVIDYDEADFYDLKKDLLPVTFTVITGSGNRHTYYYIDDTTSHKVLAEDGTTLADIQGSGKQVIGPGSRHPNGTTYSIEKDIPIATITKAQLVAAFKEHLLDDKKIRPRHNNGMDSIRDDIKTKWRVSDALGDLGIPVNKNPTECPLHTSKKNQCLSYDDNKGLWNCFHCGEGGDVFSLYMKARKQSFVQVKEDLARRLGLQVAQSFKQASKKLDTDYIAQADAFLDVQPLWYDSACLWWFWDHQKCYWRRIDETDIMNLIDVETDIDNTVRSEVQGCVLRALQRRSRLRSPKEMPATWIQFGQTIIDVETSRMFAASPEHFCTNPVPWDLGKTEETPTINRLFKEWVGEQNAPALLEIVAFSCMPDYFVQRIFSFVGSGRNGKSTFLYLLGKFIGDTNTCSARMEQLCHDRFEAAKLFRKLVCFINETNFTKVSKTEMLKALSGRDLVSAEFKGKDAFSFRNYAKIIVSTNTLPVTEDTTDGFYRRWVIIDFPNKFSEKADVIGGIPDDEFRNLARKVVRVACDLFKRREFTNEGTIEERRARYEAKSNPLKEFLTENTVSESSEHVFKFELRERFQHYCRSKGWREWTDTAIGEWMKSTGFEDSRVATGQMKDGEPIRYMAWLGIRWRRVGEVQTIISGDQQLSMVSRVSRVSGGFDSIPYPTDSYWNQKALTPVPPLTETIKNELFELLKRNKPALSVFDTDILPHFRHYTENKGQNVEQCLSVLTAVMMKELSEGNIMEVEPGKYAIVE